MTIRTLAPLASLFVGLLLSACHGDSPADLAGPADLAMPPDLATDHCGDVPESLCSPQNPGSVVRGIARFDPSKLKTKTGVGLALFLRHSFVLVDGEEQIGGRLHAYKYLSDLDASTGEIPFSIDLCELGTAMWSEENGDFHLIAILDDDHMHDPDVVGVKALTPNPGELVKMATLTISCHEASPCLDLTLDCTSGTGCTTIMPITECTSSTPSCPSDDTFCSP